MTQAWFLIALMLNMGGGAQVMTMDEIGQGPMVVQYPTQEACEAAAKWKPLADRAKPAIAKQTHMPMAMMCVQGWISE